ISYMMGISSGASLGVCLAAISGITLIGTVGSMMGQVVMAFVFSLIPMTVILIFSLKRRTTPTKIILIGVAVSYVFSACSTILMLTADEQTLADVYEWNVGSFASITWESLPIPFIVTVIGMVLSMSMNRRINVMMSGDKTAHSLGINTNRTTLVLMLIVSLMTAAVVSFCGTIGFIGLVGPHIARIFVGSESRYLIPASAAFGAVFLLMANSVASVAGQMGLPVGVVSAIIGCPLFLFILLRMRKSAWA
ncbi:MAG: FecCD family ABC transporter permease, partial [Candidatus Methanomethylophilaceae archaeon]